VRVTRKEDAGRVSRRKWLAAGDRSALRALDVDVENVPRQPRFFQTGSSPIGGHSTRNVTRRVFDPKTQ
jgi:hypothetical protein